jgi:hypothetical protein
MNRKVIKKILMQKAVREDVQCCFGVFQAHFAIIQNLRRQRTWPQSKAFS